MNVPYSAAFSAKDAALDGLHAMAEAEAKNNLWDFAGRRVLVEGGGYQKIWLETQPMGGAMYALRDMRAAVNNQLLFMEYRRADGRIPGSIACMEGKLVPQFNKFQGFCFPDPALDVGYIAGADREYLCLLYETLRGFDEYLWRVRDSDGDGLLESWCVCDTGEDRALRYGDAPMWWTEETPPDAFQRVPMPSMDVTAYSFAARNALSELSRLLQNGNEETWRRKAEDVRARIRSGFWDDARGAYFDRFKDGTRDPALIHNTLRLMYWGVPDADMAGRFVREHLLNPNEFWTPMPLPSVAANDPLFRNEPTNCWTGQPEGLTYQRAVRALENYGFLPEIARIGRKLLSAAWEGRAFSQQYDPFTGAPSLPEEVTQDVNGNEVVRRRSGYGPTILAVMEYVAFLYGIRVGRNRLTWGALSDRGESEYRVEWGGRVYVMRNGRENAAYVDGQKKFVIPRGFRAVSDLAGERVRFERIAPDQEEIG